MMSGQLVGEKILTSTSPKAVGSTDTGKKPAPPQLFVTMNGKIYSLERFQEGFVDVTVKEVDLLNELDVSKLYHCDGLVLCVATDKKKDHEPKLVLWNPYLSQTRWIEPRETFNIQDWHAIGYSSDDSDSQRNHKILRFGLGEKRDKVWYEIYDIKSNTWRVLEVVINNPVWWIDYDQGGVSVKGNAYFLAHHLIDGLYGYKRLSSSSFLRATGSSRRAAVSSSREPAVPGTDSEPSKPQNIEAGSSSNPKIHGGRSSPIVSSDNNKLSSPSRGNTSVMKNYESNLKGIESLHF